MDVEFSKLDDGSVIATVIGKQGKIFTVQADLRGSFSVKEITWRGLPEPDDLWEIYRQVLAFYNAEHSSFSETEDEQDDENGGSGG